MEDKLVTLAILTYTKAQILKNVLENEGIETYIHNVNQIQPVVSSGVSPSEKVELLIMRF